MDVAVVPQSRATRANFEDLIGLNSVVVFESQNSHAQLMSRLLVANKHHPLLLQVLKQTSANVQESMTRGDVQVDVWDLSGSVLSKTINQCQNRIPGLLRVDFLSAHSLFTRADCEYKTTFTGNWTHLQTGKQYPIYDL